MDSIYREFYQAVMLAIATGHKPGLMRLLALFRAFNDIWYHGYLTPELFTRFSTAYEGLRQVRKQYEEEHPEEEVPEAMCYWDALPDQGMLRLLTNQTVQQDIVLDRITLMQETLTRVVLGTVLAEQHAVVQQNPQGVYIVRQAIDAERARRVQKRKSFCDPRKFSQVAKRKAVPAALLAQQKTRAAQQATATPLPVPRE